MRTLAKLLWLMVLALPMLVGLAIDRKSVV